MANVTKAELLTRLQNTVAGIQKYFPNAPTLTLKGKATATQTVITLLQTYASAVQASLAAQTNAHDAVVAEKALAQQMAPVLLAIKGMVISQLGDTGAVLDAFSITATTPRKPTVEVKALAVAKQLSTRVERGTKGKRQREEIKATAPAISTPVATAKV